MIRCALLAIGAFAIGVVAAVLYYEGLHLPLVGQVIDGAIAGRLEGYVELSEKTAAEAKAEEAQRQASASEAALQSATEQIASAKAAEATASAELEQRISTYEKQLVDAKRDCHLSAADIVVMQHGSAKALPVGHH